MREEIKELKLNIPFYRSKTEKSLGTNKKNLTRKEHYKIIELEEEMKAPEITNLLCSHLENQGFYIAKERNYIGENIAPFDVACGDSTDPSDLKIYGFEIKSDKDRYDRLLEQLQHYSYVCEKIYIVVHQLTPPEWLPEWCGIIRVSKDKIFVEKECTRREPFEISTNYEWRVISKKNGLGGGTERMRSIFNQVMKIRKNILFNRFFSSYSDITGDFLDNKFFPLTLEQKNILLGFDIVNNFEGLKKDIEDYEERLNSLKSAMSYEYDRRAGKPLF